MSNRIQLRTVKPKRNHHDKQYKSYRCYKNLLRSDFNNKCGYCDVLDIYVGGKNGFHIDHFRPKSKFPHLEVDYSNLIYACPYCNIAKSDDWPGNNTESVVQNKGYIDPCSDEYDDHLCRLSNGRIIAITKLGKYMKQRLKLDLKRHQLIWINEKLDKLLRELNYYIKKTDKSDPRRNELISCLSDVLDSYLESKDHYRETL